MWLTNVELWLQLLKVPANPTRSSSAKAGSGVVIRAGDFNNPRKLRRARWLADTKSPVSSLALCSFIFGRFLAGCRISLWTFIGEGSHLFVHIP